ncbi:MAG: CoA transferase [Acetobacteraceae bacterium]
MWDPISGLWQGRDGRWIQFHCNFPHHRDGVLAVLGCGADRDAVARAVARWDMPELEEALIDKRMCIAFVRRSDEWRQHPHCAAIASLPLMEIERIGDSPPEPLPPAGRPLSNIRVLDLTRHLAGPICGRTLAEHGADVMRIGAAHLPFIPTLVMDSGHGKVNAYADLRQREGRERLLSLVRTGDVFSQAYRPGSLDALGFGPEALAAVRPGIVHVSISAFGHVGPWQGRRGFDSIIQSSSGIAFENGDERRPRHLPGNPLDYVAGYLGAFGAMVALARRAVEGGSYRVRVSLAQTGRWVESLGRVQGEDARMRSPLSHDDLGPLWQQRDTAFGRLGYVGPVVGLSETPPCWDRPASPLGTHPPAWPV